MIDRMAYPGPYEIYKRYDLVKGEEKYALIASFDHPHPRRKSVTLTVVE